MRAPHDLALSLAAGALLTLAFPEPSVAAFAWIAIGPLLVALRGSDPRRGLVLGFAFGVGFFGTLLYWISLVGWIAWLVLVVTQALFVALFGAAAAASYRSPGIVARLLVVPALWVALEFARSYFPLGGFTWGQLSQSQHDARWLLASAAIGGGWLTSFLVVTANAALADAWSSWRARRHAQLAAALLLALVALAWPLVLPAQQPSGAAVRVAIVQGNVPRSFEQPSYEKELAIIASHERLTRTLDGVDLVVWPESAVGIDPRLNQPAAQAIERAARAVDAPMIVGGNLFVDQERYQVMAFLVSPQGDIVDRYQKTHLVPFGEYVPARDLLDWIPLLEQVPRDAVPGRIPAVFELDGGAIAPLISFEGDFGPLARRRVALGARLLVVATNTSTWGTTWASAQHLAFSQVRAVENGVWVVHAALSGTSAFVAPNGAVLDRTELWEPAVAVRELRFARGVTFYARTGEWFPIACLSVLAAFALISFVGRRAANVRR